MANVYLGAVAKPKKKAKSKEPKVYQHFGVNFFTGNYTKGGGEEFITKEYKIQRSDYGIARNYLANQLRKKYPGKHFEIYYDGEYYY